MFRMHEARSSYTFLVRCSLRVKVKVKLKVKCILTSHEGPVGEQRYSSTLSLAFALDSTCRRVGLIWCTCHSGATFQVLATVLIPNLVRWHMMPFRLVLICLDTEDGGSSLLHIVTAYQSTQRNIQVDFNHYCNVVFPRPVEFSHQTVSLNTLLVHFFFLY